MWRVKWKHFFHKWNLLLHVKVKHISHMSFFFFRSVSHMEFYFPCVKRSKKQNHLSKKLFSLGSTHEKRGKNCEVIFLLLLFDISSKNHLARHQEKQFIVNIFFFTWLNTGTFFWGVKQCHPFPSVLLYITNVTIQNTKSNLSDTQHVSTGPQPK